MCFSTFGTAKEFQLCKNIELKFGKHKLCWQVIQKSILILSGSTETWFSMTKRKTARLHQFLPVRALIQFQPLIVQSRKTSYLIAGQDHHWHQQQHQQDHPPTVGELRLGLLAGVVVLRRHRLHVRTVSPSLTLQQLFFRELGFSLDHICDVEIFGYRGVKFLNVILMAGPVARVLLRMTYKNIVFFFFFVFFFFLGGGGYVDPTA